MDQVTLKIEENKIGLAEIGHGNRQVEMAFIDVKTGKNVSQIVKCKDFFQDIFWSRIKKASSAIFGFTWDHEKNDEVFSREWLCIFSRIRDNKTHNLEDLTEEQAENLGKFLNKFSDPLGIPTCNISRDTSGKYVTIEFHKTWTEIPYLLSAFLLYIRLGLSYDGQKDIIEYVTKGSNKFVSANDPLYVKSALQKIKDMLEGKLDKKQTFESYASISDIHNRSGIVNYSNYKLD